MEDFFGIRVCLVQSNIAPGSKAHQEWQVRLQEAWDHLGHVSRCNFLASADDRITGPEPDCTCPPSLEGMQHFELQETGESDRAPATHGV
jgi:hypothetical protein